MTFKAVIFDFGGVITSSPFEAFNRMEAERGLPRDFVRAVNSANPDSNAWAKFERAEIDAVAFDALFADEAQALGHRLEGNAVIACLSGDIRPAMVAALDHLKAEGFKLGCITNNVPTGRTGLLGAGMAGSEDKAVAVDAIMARFDHVIESSKIGIRKPDPRIYSMMCDVLGVEPAECVYLDDLGINCKPAAALGMQAIKVTGGEQALDELATLLALTPAPVGG
jgi:putative hydrolase of the HAD superfamily